MQEATTIVPIEVGDATFDQRVRAADPAGATATAASPRSPVRVSWVPVDACTLSTKEQPLRVAEFDALFAGALRGLERRGPGWLRLVLTGAPQVEAAARELLVRESNCCSFFDFRLTPANGDRAGELLLDVRVRDSRVEVLDGIARQAKAVLTSRPVA